MKIEIEDLDNLDDYTMRCSCGWIGLGTDCKLKRYGEYCRGYNEEYGWEEWDNLACPKCGKEVYDNEMSA
jgi:hypothetical protein